MTIPAAGQDVAVAGVDSYLLKGKESIHETYPTIATTIESHFGVDQRATPVVRNTLLQIRGFKGSSTGGRAMIKALGGRLECGISVEFQPNVWDFMEDTLGNVSGDGSSGDPYVYVKASNLPTYSIATSIELGSTDQDVVFIGSVVNTCTIRATMGEVVTVTLEYLSATMKKTNTLQTPVALSSLDVFIFSGVSLEYPDGTSVEHPIDSIEITITNNVEIRPGLGSRLGKKAVAKQLEYSIRITLDKMDDEWIDDFLGHTEDPATNPTRVANMGIKFTNSVTHDCDFVFTGVTVDENPSEQTYGEVIPEDITLLAESLIVTEIQSA